MQKPEIGILTTVANFELYNITSQYFPKGIKRYVIDGSNGMHGIYSIFYMFKKLSKEGIDWLILADEDVIFKESNVVFSIIDKMKKEKITVSGVRDGGVIKHRAYNPFMVNTFFTIINFKEILADWNFKEVKKHQYILPNEFTIDRSELKGQYDLNSLYEPYYCFFLWLKRKERKFLYLEGIMLEDDISNSLLFNGKEFAYHTWYARSYNVNKKHTKRINNILLSLDIDINNDNNNSNNLHYKIYRDAFFHVKIKIKKYYTRIVNKLSGKSYNIQ
ncbi:hypothetical protein [Hwangdonia lutea]|uniref:Uncharacterized protein n=1 Tax=Hwangdonia lutea TaxID=3075823 RepID=A0AA97EN29_9FLAO|nr:hypothetical protein [Hwangdonia sp. SCSIO 19198]WOD43971.1 hypothetical protein RNZ46_01620 [Hwangdonia sp. SCSIO 19198]